MAYISTRGGTPPLGFEDTVLHGLAPDGGLFLPERVPDVSGRLAAWQRLDFRALCAEVFHPYVAGSLDDAALADLIDRSYARFDYPEVTPLVAVGDLFVLELFHGPTLAFKDVALQFLGELFADLLARRDARLTVLGATSGDTGSAAIHALKGKDRIEVFILHPRGRVSPVQERQMTTVSDPNVHCVAVEGSFDDAQAIVKTLFNDRPFNDEVRLGAVNSINWARLMAQITYFFYAYFRLLERPAGAMPGGRALRLGDPVRYVVPTGNFGHIFAGILARRMGLPIERLVLATNANDILHRFVSTGEYRAGSVQQTWSPSMDIQVASNFERYLYDLAGRDPAVLREWMATFADTGTLRIPEAAFARVAEELLSYATDEAATLDTIRQFHRGHGYLLDPHTAVGVRAALEHRAGAGEIPTVCMATAHPAKFGDAIRAAIEQDPPLPAAIAELERLPTRVTPLPADAEAVKAFIRRTLEARAAEPVPRASGGA